MKIEIVDGVEGKAYIIEMSTIYDFYSSPPTIFNLIFNFHTFFLTMQARFLVDFRFPVKRLFITIV